MTAVLDVATPRVLPGGAAVRLSGATKVFPSGSTHVTALDQVDLTVEPGEFLTVVGASGCGKSTMLNLIAGLDRPTSGTVEVAGRVAFMFQDATLFSWLTARQNVELALRLRGLPRRLRRQRAQELLDVVRLGPAQDKRPHELSGGMRQRVALARVLAQDASVVLMDEPLGALDAMTRDHMHGELERVWMEAGLTVVFVTHNMREAVRLGDRVVLMASAPGRVKLERPVTMRRPRVIDSAGVAELAGTLTDELRAEVALHVR
jgi:NitT/TauT family transport system ATP-binding protein